MSCFVSLVVSETLICGGVVLAFFLSFIRIRLLCKYECEYLCELRSFDINWNVIGMRMSGL